MNGAEIRREVLGDEHVNRTARDEFRAPFTEYVTDAVWGQIWGRPGLDRRTRSMLTVALLAGLGHHQELPMHLRAAIRNGVTPAEIQEVLLHTCAYAGVPTGNSAFAIAAETLAEPPSNSAAETLAEPPSDSAAETPAEPDHS